MSQPSSPRRAILARSRSPTTTSSVVTYSKISPRLTRSQSKKLKGDVDESRFIYEILADSGNVKNYHTPPNKHAPMTVKQVSKLTNKTNYIKLEWQYLPFYAQRKWLERRRNMWGLTMLEQNKNNNQIGDSNLMVKKASKRKKENDSYMEDQKKKKENESGFERMESESIIDDDDVVLDEALDGAASVEKKDGAGIKPIDFNFIPYNVKNRIVYEYFDDPNELCDRLRLLISSKMAGNSNHMQEINSIVEELRELKCIV